MVEKLRRKFQVKPLIDENRDQNYIGRIREKYYNLIIIFGLMISGFYFFYQIYGFLLNNELSKMYLYDAIYSSLLISSLIIFYFLHKVINKKMVSQA